MHWLKKADVGDGGCYLDEKRFDYTELREKCYDRPYTTLSPAVVNFRGSEPGANQALSPVEPSMRDPKKEVTVKRRKGPYQNLEQGVIGPNQHSNVSSPADSYPADQTALPTIKPECGDEYAYIRVVTDY